MPDLPMVEIGQWIEKQQMENDWLRYQLWLKAQWLRTTGTMNVALRVAADQRVYGQSGIAVPTGW